MFLIRYFKYSFQFSTLFSHVKEKGWKVFLYFMLLSFIAIFPSNYRIVTEQGWRLDFIEESFRMETPNWQLPDEMEIKGGKLITSTDETYTLTHRGLTFIFNAKPSDVNVVEKTILFYDDAIVYDNGNGNQMVARNYQGFEDVFSFRALNLMSGSEKEEAYIEFGRQIEQSFSDYIVFYSLFVNTMTTIGTYMLYLVLLAFILQLFRFGYSKFMSYMESLKFLVFLMGLPAILGFAVGLIEPAFGAVIFQFAMGITAMLVMLFYGKKVFA